MTQVGVKGTQNRIRSCTNPKPGSGGKKCPGEDSESKKCDITKGELLNKTKHASIYFQLFYVGSYE